MNIFSIDDLIEELTGKPSTFQWGAVIAFDTYLVNLLLMQEYIDRFNKEAFLEPISGDFPMTDGVKETISGFLLDQPRLSFADSTINSSSAQLLLRGIKGARSREELDGAGMYTTVLIDALDILSGPMLTMTLDLKMVPGSVGQDEIGAVTLDITEGSNLGFSYASGDYEHEKWTSFFKRKFEDFKAENGNKVIYVLNKIGSNKGNFLQVEDFSLRTHQAPGAKVRNSANYNQGELVIFVRMLNQVGTPSIPDKDSDMPYLTPDDTSVSILLGNRYLQSNIVSKGCESIVNDNNFDFKLVSNDEDLISKMSVTQGQTLHGPISNTTLQHFSRIEITNVNLPMFEQDVTGFDVTFELDKLKLHWKGSKLQPAVVEVKGGQRYTHALRLSWDVSREYRFELNAHNTTVELKHITANDINQYKVSPGNYASIPEVANHFGEISNFIDTEFIKVLKTALDRFASPTSEINLFTLHTLLFRTENAVELQQIRYPYDLLTFGRLAPSRTDFAITPQEITLLDNQTYQFMLEGLAPANVHWTVRSAPGYESGVGTINDGSGFYTAPKGDQIVGGYTRVVVTATDVANNQRKSSALVTIVVSSIEVNPKVRYGRTEIQEGYLLFVGSKNNAPVSHSVTQQYYLPIDATRHLVKLKKELDKLTNDLAVPRLSPDNKKALSHKIEELKHTIITQQQQEKNLFEQQQKDKQQQAKALFEQQQIGRVQTAKTSSVPVADLTNTVKSHYREGVKGIEDVVGTITKEDEGRYRYIPPLKDQDIFCSVDKVTFTNDDTKAAQSSCILTTHTTSGAFIRYQSQPNGEALLELVDSRNRPIIADDRTLIIYHVVQGFGKVEQRGSDFYYQPATTNEELFALLVAEVRDIENPRYDDFGFRILPLPLANADELASIDRTQPQ